MVEGKEERTFFYYALSRILMYSLLFWFRLAV